MNAKNRFGHVALVVALPLMGATLVTNARAEGASLSTDDLGKGGEDGAPATNDDSAFLLAGKVGAIASFNGLSPFVHGGIDLGYVFGGTNRTMGAYLGTEYTAPSSTGSATEDETPERIPGGKYSWEIRQKELVFQPSFLYRFTWLTDAVVPFVGIGPRIYLLESVVRGSSGGEKIHDTRETSTKFGVGLPLGLELPLGPGGLMAEFLFQWGPLNHRATGDTHLGGGSLFLGYRALL